MASFQFACLVLVSFCPFSSKQKNTRNLIRFLFLPVGELHSHTGDCIGGAPTVCLGGRAIHLDTDTILGHTTNGPKRKQARNVDVKARPSQLSIAKTKRQLSKVEQTHSKSLGKIQATA